MLADRAESSGGESEEDTEGPCPNEQRENDAASRDFNNPSTPIEADTLGVLVCSSKATIPTGDANPTRFAPTAPLSFFPVVPMDPSDSPRGAAPKVPSGSGAGEHDSPE